MSSWEVTGYSSLISSPLERDRVWVTQAEILPLRVIPAKAGIQTEEAKPNGGLSSGG
jgi:hypothetical protein